MLDAVTGFLSILIARLERIGDRRRALYSNDGRLDSSLATVEVSYSRRMLLLGRAIFFAVLSALVTAALLIAGFIAALVGAGHPRVVPMLFTIALVLLIAALVDLTREIRLYMATMSLD